MNLFKNTTLAFGSLLLLLFVVSSCGSNSSTEQTEADSTTVVLDEKPEMFFKISLAEWSYHKALQANEFTNLDFPGKAVELGINAVEYVSVFFDGNEQDQDYLNKLKSITDSLGVTNVLIMVDREGNLGDLDEAKRIESVENHYKWVDAAKFLGCHSIRVNARGEGTSEEVKAAAIDGLSRLSEYGAEKGINIIVENHGGYSSDGTWLTEVIKGVNNPFCGTLPDFGNFRIEEGKYYDIYKGMEEMMPFAKGVSAKAYAFDNGPESAVTTGGHGSEDGIIDFGRIMKIVKDAGYTGYVGIEFEGDGLSEKEGIIKTKEVLELVGSQL
ncbi:MAG: sugar phosphate isomerase/epimerase [Cyclobacteriaceae bacterium]|nr:sugar phosphate isomerase/epimerase [Cyclobacteriaceae bacterium]